MERLPCRISGSERRLLPLDESYTAGFEEPIMSVRSIPLNPTQQLAKNDSLISEFLVGGSGLTRLLYIAGNAEFVPFTPEVS